MRASRSRSPPQKRSPRRRPPERCSDRRTVAWCDPPRVARARAVLQGRVCGSPAASDARSDRSWFASVCANCASAVGDPGALRCNRHSAEKVEAENHPDSVRGRAGGDRPRRDRRRPGCRCGGQGAGGAALGGLPELRFPQSSPPEGGATAGALRPVDRRPGGPVETTIYDQVWHGSLHALFASVGRSCAIRSPGLRSAVNYRRHRRVCAHSSACA